MLVVLWPDGDGAPERVHCFACAAPPAAPWPGNATAICLPPGSGPRCALPLAARCKDSAWATARAPFEAMRDRAVAQFADVAAFADALLVDAYGQVLEGLVSNVWVLVGHERGGDPAAVGTWCAAETAEHDAPALKGIASAALVRAATSMGVAVDSAPVAVHDARASWSAVLLANAVRGLTPVHRVYSLTAPDAHPELLWVAPANAYANGSLPARLCEAFSRECRD